MNAEITKLEVFLYYAEELNRTRRRQIEEAARNDPKVQRWLAELAPTDEDLADEPVPDLSSSDFRQAGITAMVNALQEDEETELTAAEHGLSVPLLELADLIRQAPEGRLPKTDNPILLDWNRNYGVAATTATLELVSKFHDDDSTRFPTLPDVPYLVVEDDILYLAQRPESVPFGVVRIIASKDGIPLASTLRCLEYNRKERAWKTNLSVASVFDNDLITGKLEWYAVPANEEYRGLFSKKEVTQLLGGLPESWTDERTAVGQLLEVLER